jgi:hypothetical protein
MLEIARGKLNDTVQRTIFPPRDLMGTGTAQHTQITIHNINADCKI